jgi:hypothetical protein
MEALELNVKKRNHSGFVLKDELQKKATWFSLNHRDKELVSLSCNEPIIKDDIIEFDIVFEYVER